jgi:release factor glutamine methyltransferase
MPEIYEPREDTFLILKEVAKLSSGNVLDMGTGSGILAFAAAVKADSVIGADINPDAVEFCKKRAAELGVKNTSFIVSDLFSYFERHALKFDLIIFNPPYLPEMHGEEEEVRTIVSGGKKGYETLERFFSQASEYLMPFGKILVLFSTLTGKDKVHEIIERFGFSFQKLSEEDLFGETLFVYECEKSSFLRRAEAEGVSGMHKIAKGHRGIVYKGEYKNEIAAIKRQSPESAAIGRMENEARWLKVLNRKGIGPKFYFSDNDYFVSEYIDGIIISDFLKQETSKHKIHLVLAEVLRQCFVLDNMRVTKEEMHNPYKHIIIREGKPVMIDFERTHFSEEPKNVTQFCQYIMSKQKILNEKGFKIHKLKMQAAAKNYKEDMSRKNLATILHLIK